MLAITKVVTAPVPWSDVVYVGAAVIAALGAFIAVPMFFYFLKDRKRILLRQEVQDESRRREQLEVSDSEKSKLIDRLNAELVEERKKTDLSGIASTLGHVAATLNDVVEANGKILDKLGSVNGSFDRVMERLDASTKAVEASTRAIEFLATQVVLSDPDLPRARTRKPSS
jgi:uncharacterized coiled-coil protein SlyX